MPVITRCKAGIYTFQEFNGWFIIRILRYEFSMNGKVKNFVFGLLDNVLQIILPILDNIN